MLKEVFKDKRILVIGDIMLDQYLYCAHTRQSPEDSSVPVYAVLEHKFSLGGAANVAANIVSLGGRASLLGCIGDDPFGEMLADMISHSGINKRLLHESIRPTTVKTRVYDGHRQMLRVDNEDDSHLSEDLQVILLESALSKIKRADCVVFSDYDKGVINKSLIQSVIKEANECRVPVVADPKYRNFEHYKRVTVFKVNRNEFDNGWPKVDCVRSDVSEKGSNKSFNASLSLHKNLGILNLLVTNGSKSTTCLTHDSDEVLTVKPYPVDIADACGAGDVFTAGLALGAASLFPIKEALEFANKAATISVQYPGCYAVSLSEVENASF